LETRTAVFHGVDAAVTAIHDTHVQNLVRQITRPTNAKGVVFIFPRRKSGARSDGMTHPPHRAAARLQE
jgi:hypothetical protein